MTTCDRSLDLLSGLLMHKVNRRGWCGWQLGRLDPVTVRADRERLGLALDALLENAGPAYRDRRCRTVSVIRGWSGMPVRIVVADGGGGIPEDRLHLVFDRFRTGDDHESREPAWAFPRARGSSRVRADPAGAVNRAAGAAGRVRRRGGGRDAGPVRGRRPGARAARECQAMTVRER